MNLRWTLLAAGMMMALGIAGPGLARADVKSGFGLAGGVASHSATAKISPKFGSGSLSYASSGLSIAFDYQVMLTPWLSLNPFLLGSGETTAGDYNTGTKVSHGVLGIGLRYWPGDFFVGAHLGNYSETFTSADGSASIDSDGSGFGFSAGWESPDGLFAFGQVDAFSLSYVDADVVESAARFHVGYRWK